MTIVDARISDAKSIRHPPWISRVIKLRWSWCCIAQADSNKGLTSVAFPAGWNNATPWFKAGGAQQAAGAVQGAAGGKRAMPPPAFPAQPWQGSRLGPLPPIGPYSLAVPHLDEVCLKNSFHVRDLESKMPHALNSLHCSCACVILLVCNIQRSTCFLHKR